MTATTNLAEALQAGTKKSVLTVECLPPGGPDPQAVEKLAESLPQTADAIVVADNPDEARGSALACAAILARAGRQPVLSIATRDRNRIALESDVLGAASLGVRIILCLSGDHQSLGICPPAAGAYDIDSIQLGDGPTPRERAAPGGARHPTRAHDAFLVDMDRFAPVVADFL